MRTLNSRSLGAPKTPKLVTHLSLRQPDQSGVLRELQQLEPFTLVFSDLDVCASLRGPAQIDLAAQVEDLGVDCSQQLPGVASGVRVPWIAPDQRTGGPACDVSLDDRILLTRKRLDFVS